MTAQDGPPDAPPARTPDPTPAPATSRRRAWVIGAAVALTALLVLVAWLAGLPGRLLRPSATEIRGALYTAIQRETPETFLVTGAVDLSATTRVANTRRLLPGLLNLNLGTTSATVRMPGRVSYGVDLSRIEPEDIEVGEAGEVRVTVPAPTIWSVEPVLAEMEVETDVGWARLDASGRDVEQEAIRMMERALRAQGVRHLHDSDQPRRNTARALERAFGPPLEAAGVADPRIEVLFSDTRAGED